MSALAAGRRCSRVAVGAGLVLLATLPASPSLAQSASPGPAVEDLRAGATFRFQIHPSLPVHVFRLVGDPASNTVERIEVSRDGEATPFQILEDIDMEPPYRGARYFRTEDVNFDGYQDIKLLRWWGATGNAGYAYWLFDPATRRFVFSPELSELSNPTPDPRTREITTHSVEGMAGRIYTDRAYRFDNGALVLVREDAQSWVDAGRYFLRTLKERRDGRMETIREERRPE